VESLLNYADRFYHRQFITREKANHQVLEGVETLLDAYFNSPDVAEKGLPTVRYMAEHLHLSPKYLSNLLRVLTGQNTQQHIHAKLIAKAKERLAKLLTSWVLSICNPSANYSKPKRTCRRWSLGRLLTDGANRSAPVSGLLGTLVHRSNWYTFVNY
jgi:AraC-like DNA-binding protein